MITTPVAICHPTPGGEGGYPPSRSAPDASVPRRGDAPPRPGEDRAPSPGSDDTGGPRPGCSRSPSRSARTDRHDWAPGGWEPRRVELWQDARSSSGSLPPTTAPPPGVAAASVRRGGNDDGRPRAQVSLALSQEQAGPRVRQPASRLRTGGSKELRRENPEAANRSGGRSGSTRICPLVLAASGSGSWAADFALGGASPLPPRPTLPESRTKRPGVGGRAPGPRTSEVIPCQVTSLRPLFRRPSSTPRNRRGHRGSIPTIEGLPRVAEREGWPVDSEFKDEAASAYGGIAGRGWRRLESSRSA